VSQPIEDFYFVVDFLCFNATFSNISAISWRPVLVVEEARVPGQNHHHGKATAKLYSGNLLEQQAAVRNITLHRHIILISSQPVFALSPL
jgi:hypothetical protein